MKVLLFLTIRLWLVLSMFIGLAVGIGQQQPPEPYLTGLRLTDCQPPCWIGIIPGKSTMSEARRQIWEVFSVNTVFTDNGLGLYANVRKHHFSIQISTMARDPRTAVVRTISLSLEPHHKRQLGALINMFGGPDKLTSMHTSMNNRSTVLYYHQSGLYLTTQWQTASLCNPLKPHTILRMVQVSTIDLTMAQTLKTWDGFRSCYP